MRWTRFAALVATAALASCDDAASAPAAHPGLARVAAGYRLAEGPVWLDGRLLFSDVIGDTVYEWRPGMQPTVVRRPSGWANGHALDQQGRLIEAQHATGRVVRYEANGTATILAERFEGRRLNSPNDVAIGPDGAVWFTDPPFGITPPYGPRARASEIGFNGVYRVSAGGSVELMARSLDQPNGIGFASDGRTLYVSDTASGRISAFPIGRTGRLGEGRDFGPGVDGLKVDREGRVWSATGEGVVVLSPEGAPIARIPTPEPVTSLAFGGRGGRTLFVTTYTALHRLENPLGQPPR